MAPVIAEVVLMIVYGVPAAQIATVATQSALFWALWLCVIMSLAALTPNLAKFALVIGGGIMAIVVFIFTTFAILVDRMNDEPPLSGGGDGYDPTSDIARTVMVIAAAIVLLAVQYRTRARVRAVAIGAAGGSDRIDCRQRLAVAVVGTEGRHAGVGCGPGYAASFRSCRHGANRKGRSYLQRQADAMEGDAGARDVERHRSRLVCRYQSP